MRANYLACLAILEDLEGGYVNHPKDPGGPTNHGVTQKVYDAYRKRTAQPLRSVRAIEEREVGEIYQVQYWMLVKGDALPVGLDLCTFDGAVNSGPYRGAQWLQRALSVPADGIIGNITLAAAEDVPPEQLGAVIDQMCAVRMAFLRRRKTWPTFGTGWTRRVARIRREAQAMVAPA